MSWRSSISEGLLNAHRTDGRMTRVAFWQFAPLGLLLPLAFASQINWLQIHIWHGMAYLTILFLLSLPLLNALARRLRDAGFEADQAYVPFAPFVVLWVGYQMILWGGIALAYAGGGILTFFLWILALIVLVPLHLIALVSSVFVIANLIGQALVATLPDPEMNGPNPREVPQ